MKFQSLDGCRGVCAIFVVLLHLPLRTPPFDGPLIRNSYLFVDFFFVLSGFVISHAYGGRLKSLQDVTRFGVRRFCRLWPLHVAMLAVLVVMEAGKIVASDSYGGSMTAPFSDERSVKLLIANIFLVQIWQPEPTESWNVPSWSISVEFWTYFVFAFVQIVLFRRRRLVAVALCAGSLAALGLRSARGMDVVADLAVFRCFSGFFAGALLHEASTWRPNGSPTRPGLPASVIELAAVAAVAGFLSVAGHSGLSLASPIVFAGLVAIFADGCGVVSAALRSRLLQFLGRISYSIYLVHTVLLLVAMRALHVLDRKLGTAWLQVTAAHDGAPAGEYLLLGHTLPALGFAATFLLVLVAVCDVTFRLVEAPAMRWAARLMARPSA